jgi:hypothetical protein
VVLSSDLQDNRQVSKEIAISSIWRFATAQYLRLNSAQRGPSGNVFTTPITQDELNLARYQFPSLMFYEPRLLPLPSAWS